MREGSPSTTAQLVALARAVYARAEPPYRAAVDPLAERFLSPPAAALARWISRAWVSPRVAQRLVRAISFGFAGNVALRTAAIDDAVREGIVAAKQLVILGAGLDARAFRMPELHDVRAFEVDHPATQLFKRARAEGAVVRARELVFVPVDFERERLDDALARAGHDPAAPSVWIWEGVTMYLAPEAVHATLDVIARRSPVKSMLVLTYAPAEVLDERSGLAALLRSAGRALGESLKWAPSRDELRATLDAHGFATLRDESPREWAPRYWSGANESTGGWERLAVAARR